MTYTMSPIKKDLRGYWRIDIADSTGKLISSEYSKNKKMVKKMAEQTISKRIKEEK